MTSSGPKNLSGQRFSVRYHLTGTETAAQATAASICREQTVEVPDEVIPLGPIREQIVGRLEAFHRVASGAFEATISFATETAGAEFTQLLNVIFGNISLQPGIRVARVDVPASGFSWLKGPRFGRKGMSKQGSSRAIAPSTIGSSTHSAERPNPSGSSCRA